MLNEMLLSGLLFLINTLGVIILIGDTFLGKLLQNYHARLCKSIIRNICLMSTKESEERRKAMTVQTKHVYILKRKTMSLEMKTLCHNVPFAFLKETLNVKK